MSRSSIFFFFNDTATTEIYTLSLHDALPILTPDGQGRMLYDAPELDVTALATDPQGNLYAGTSRSEEHTSELQSLTNLVCRLLLEEKKWIEGRRRDVRCAE